MLKIKVLDKREKFEKIKLVEPNIIFNRHDIRFENDFELLEVIYNSNTYYIPFHIAKDYAYLGVYMTNINKVVFKNIIKYINKNFAIERFYFLQSLNPYKGTNKTIHSLLELPNSVEEFNKRFASKSRWSRKSKKQKLEKSYQCEYLHYKREGLTEELMQEFLDLKRISHNNAYHDETGKDLLGEFYHITDAYVLKINGKIAAIVLFSIIDNENVYYTNITFDKTYSKYGIGVMMYYIGIEDLISRGYKRIYLGGGEYDYKKNSKAIVTKTSEGYFNYMSFKKRLFSIIYEVKNGIIYKYLNLFGHRFLLKTVTTNYEMYRNWFKKISMQKYLKKLAKEYKDKRIIIYGTGLMSQVLFENYDLSELNIVAVCDKKYENKQGELFHSIKCISPDELETIDYDIMLVLILRNNEICRKIKKSVPFLQIKL